MLAMPGFLGWVGVTVGDRMLTITAWEDAEAPRQLMHAGRHPSAVKEFFGPDLSAGAFTSVFVPERMNTRWVRCGACQKMADYASRNGTCTCGVALPEPMPYW